VKILCLNWGNFFDPPMTHQVGELGDVLKSTYPLDIFTHILHDES